MAASALMAQDLYSSVKVSRHALSILSDVLKTLHEVSQGLN